MSLLRADGELPLETSNEHALAQRTAARAGSMCTHLWLQHGSRGGCAGLVAQTALEEKGACQRARCSVRARREATVAGRCDGLRVRCTWLLRRF
jgi:hypothetical protein